MGTKRITCKFCGEYMKSYDLYTMDLKETYKIVQNSNNRKIYEDYDY